MTFESRILAFADRFLSDRTVQLIVEPALADLQFDGGTSPLGRAANRFAVLTAVAGGLRDEVARGSAGFIALTLMPTCYYLFLMVICFDFRPSSTGLFAGVATLILVMSLAPVMVCFWPSRHTGRQAD
jgi:hypothetical protein